MSAEVNCILREAPPMEYWCKVCGKCDGEPQGWRFVIEMSKPGTDIRNTLFIVEKWDDRHMASENTACLCSPTCEEKYLSIRHRQLVA